jgi:putative transposase
MQNLEKFVPGNIYHVYNKGINGENLFVEPENYYHFINLFEKYLGPVGDTFAWCLMPNHFHFLLKINDPVRVPYPYTNVMPPSRAISHLCNAYTQAFNKKYKRTGALFQRPFQRKVVRDEEYFRQLIFYIHNNPVKHGFCERIEDYPWSSFRTLLSIKGIRSNKSPLQGWFSSKSEFICFHKEEHDTKDICTLLLE